MERVEALVVRQAGQPPMLRELLECVNVMRDGRRSGRADPCRAEGEINADGRQIGQRLPMLVCQSL